ncbi:MULTISPECIES: hypothetical protein [Lactobacillaceae]|uniref:hypothetical protein n=1 Tax=Lactobacillaceae TaxID=33958 RepID=UPI001CABD9A2|nr:MULTISPECIES: hypothetical protein [Lactobacillaceae]MBY7145960.1 hypothetical protein [Levilactobacillus brevis]MCP9615466.1 hypothetical protein [Levilactobacillus brevis]MDP0529895.1 hypothetical protein [Lacticaseibacillus paracasei]
MKVSNDSLTQEQLSILKSNMDVRFSTLKELTTSLRNKKLLDSLEYDLIGQYIDDEQEGLERFNTDGVFPVISNLWLFEPNSFSILNLLDSADDIDDVYRNLYALIPEN